MNYDAMEEKISLSLKANITLFAHYNFVRFFEVQWTRIQIVRSGVVTACVLNAIRIQVSRQEHILKNII